LNPIIVYVDDASYALPLVQALAASPQAQASHWLLVACAPRITHRVSKWVSHSARESWRGKWADKLFAQLLPVFGDSAGRITPVLAKGPLAELVAQLQQEHGTAQIVDARRPKQEATTPAVAPAAPLGRRWNLPGTLAAIGALMGLVFEEAMI